MSQKNWDLKQIPTQKGKVAIITGANAGLGYETALALAGKEATVILACRNMEKAAKAKAKILEQFPNASLECREIDLSKLKSVRAFAANFIKDHSSLHLLINNAGIMMPPFSKTEDGFESQLAANYLGHFLLTELLLETVMKTPGSRIISLSSLAHLRGKIQLEDLNYEQKYSPMGAYSQSKLACLIFAIELQRRLEKAGSSTISLAAHPGLSNTELSRDFSFWFKLAKPVIDLLYTQSAEKGALPTLRAALDENAKGGEYYGPKHKKEYKGPPVKVKPRRTAMDEALAKKLWSVSEELTNCKYSL